MEEKTFKVQVLSHLDSKLDITYLKRSFVLEILLGFMCYDRDSLQRAVNVVENGFVLQKQIQPPGFCRTWH